MLEKVSSELWTCVWSSWNPRPSWHSREGWRVSGTSPNSSGKDPHTKGEDPAPGHHPLSLGTWGLWAACHCGPTGCQTHLLVGSGVVGTPSGREGGGPCASSHKYQTLGMAGGEQNYWRRKTVHLLTLLPWRDIKTLVSRVAEAPLQLCGMAGQGMAGHRRPFLSWLLFSHASPVLLKSRKLCFPSE